MPVNICFNLVHGSAMKITINEHMKDAVNPYRNATSNSRYAMNPSSFGDREDNHCQEDGRAKSAWRETRIFGGFGLFVLSSFA